MSDWLTERLRAGAESATAGTALDHPGGPGAEPAGTPVVDADGDDASVPPGDVIVLADAAGARRPRRLWVAAAAAVVAVMGGGAWFALGGDRAQPVKTPADPAGPTAPIPDPATAPAPEVVKAAIERTMAQSWVADTVMNDEDWTITYLPPDPRGGRWGEYGEYLAVQTAGHTHDTYLAPTGGALLERMCIAEVPTDAACEDVDWQPAVGTEGAGIRTHVEAALNGMGMLDPATAEGGSPGRYTVAITSRLLEAPQFEVALRGCFDQGRAVPDRCTFDVVVKDGLLATLSLNKDTWPEAVQQGLGSWSYHDIGAAPPITKPDPGKISNPVQLPTTTVMFPPPAGQCSIEVGVIAGTEMAVVYDQLQHVIGHTATEVADGARSIPGLTVDGPTPECADATAFGWNVHVIPPG